jgi:transposase InsO family protein
MSNHRNAKLGLAGRYALVSAIAEGMTLKQAAACFNVSPATAHRWWHRWREATAEPGDLLHTDTSEYARFQRPGHRVTGDRSSQDRRHRDGVDYVHAIVDDHSRLAYAELHDDQRAETVIAFLERALGYFTEHGIVCKRLMTDNGWSYVKSRTLRELLARRRIRHLTTEPYRPRTNGKVERFHQTMAREWAYRLVYSSHRERAAALPHWLHHYGCKSSRLDESRLLCESGVGAGDRELKRRRWGCLLPRCLAA